MARPIRVGNFIVLLLVVVVNYSIAFRIENNDDDQIYWVISMDAFGPDCLQRNVTPIINKFRETGVSAPYMDNVFPTKTFPNHFTVATGLYAESHGVLGNSLYDPKYGHELKYGYDLFHYNDSVLPIWTLNEIAGQHSGCMMWPGSNFMYADRPCTFTQPLDMKMDWIDRVNLVISWIKHEKTPANFVMMYIENPDDIGHSFGPESPQYTHKVQQLDMLLEKLQQILIDENLEKRVNLIFVSDHGMDTVRTRDFIDLYEFVDPNSCDMYGASPVLQIIPKNGFKEEVKANLTQGAIINGNFNIYNETSLPSQWRVHNDGRFGPITAVAKIKYAFQDMHGLAKWINKHYNVPLAPDTPYGLHGWDNAYEKMRAVFMCKGPAFNEGVVVPPFGNVDLFNFFSRLLNIKAVPNEGADRSHIWDMIIRN